MNCSPNIITANFSGGKTSATTAPLWQWDYGQVLCITGIEDLPATFEVHFSTNKTGGVSTVAVGADGQVTIPNVLLTIGKNLNAWIYLSDSEGEGETEYSILIPVKARPMPETYDAEATGVFDDVVRQVSEYAETAQTAADNAGASASAATASAENAAASASAAETAKTAAETAQGKAEDAQAAAETAAQTATQKSEQTAQDAAQAASDAGRAESAAQSAEAAQMGAENAKTDTETAAQGAAASASAASENATSAVQAATSAAQSATAAAGSATTAQGAAQTATTKAGEASASATAAAASATAAQTARTAAEAAETNAGQSASTATAKAAEAVQSASGAAQSKTDAEAAAARAEQAAATLMVDTALSDTSTNPVQNKVITGELTDVKSETDYLRKASLMKSEIVAGWKKTRYINLYKSIGTIITVQNSEVSSANYDYIWLPVETGDQFVLTGSGGSDPRLFAWLDENNALLYKAVVSLEVMDYTLIAPSNGYLIVNVKREEEYHLYKMKRTSNYIVDHEYYYYPEDYGAVGDGVADDTDALQKCIDEAYLNKKPVLLRGKYATSRRLLVYGAIDNTQFGSIIRGVSVGDTAIIGTSDPIILTYSGQYLIDGKAHDRTGARIEISNLQIRGSNKTNVGIRFRGSTANIRIDSVKFFYCSNAMETTEQVYLSQFRRIRCDQCVNGFYFPLIKGGFNTSLLIDSCYVQSCENAYTIAGSYMNIINSCCDHVSGICLDLTHFNGAVNGFGCETPNAKTIIKAGNHTYATIVNPYTYGNYNDADSCQIDIGALARVTIIGGTMGFDEKTSHDKLAGHIVNISDETAHVEFVNTRFWQSDISNFVNMDGIESCDVIYNTMKYNGISFDKIGYIESLSARPNTAEVGQMIFDTTLGKPIWFTGSNWIDANGQTV